MKFLACKPTHLLLLFNIYLLTSANPAVKHNHGQNNLNKERLQDGSYSPRDQGHISEDGEHHSEFDHEAILGKLSVIKIITRR